MYQRDPGDTWAFTIIADRLPLGACIVLVYFGVFNAHPGLGTAVFALSLVLLVWTTPHRFGIGVALHYLSRVYWPDPADPVPPPATTDCDDRVQRPAR